MNQNQTGKSPQKVALITGGTRGVGFAIAKELVHRGYGVALMYRRQRKRANEALAELQSIAEATAGRIVIFRGDAADANDVEAFCEATVSALGQIDLVIANAASGSLKPLMDQTPQSWEWTMKINHLGPFLLIKSATPVLKKNASIVVLSSLGSRYAIPNYGFVGASKAALESLVRQAAYELGPSGIRVNAICAGALNTEALQHFPDGEAVLQASRQYSRYNSDLDVADIARIAAFLGSPESKGIQGQTLVVDNGHSLHLPG